MPHTEITFDPSDEEAPCIIQIGAAIEKSGEYGSGAGAQAVLHPAGCTFQRWESSPGDMDEIHWRPGSLDPLPGWAANLLVAGLLADQCSGGG